MKEPAFSFDALPSVLAVFPLSGVLLLPRGQLPLHIFEPRYVAMVEDSLRAQRIIGMIQPTAPDETTLFQTGCAGKITTFDELDNGCFRITLTGLCRFHIVSEHETTESGYRRIHPDWAPFHADMNAAGCLNLDREKLESLLRAYFARNEMTCQWSHIHQAADEKLITCLSMICPFAPGEKQALLEARTCRDRADLFMTLLDMAVKSMDAESRH
ncbi:MAG: LON peptidase substrate-binding domain-containing protein [Rhodospirillales bacterium]|nr:LON peptidase substrate-binding domain-containing protein [Rhodospirillales bacterium]